MKIKYTLLYLTICSSEIQRKGGHLDRLLRLQQSTRVHKRLAKIATFLNRFTSQVAQGTFFMKSQVYKQIYRCRQTYVHKDGHTERVSCKGALLLNTTVPDIDIPRKVRREKLYYIFGSFRPILTRTLQGIIDRLNNYSVML